MTPFQRKQLDLMRHMEATLAAGSHGSTIVPMQTDYATDAQIALTCVNFIDKDLTATIQTQIIRPLQELEPEFYYYPGNALHLTIQNIRVINDPPHFNAADIAKVQQILTEITPPAGPFEFALAGLLSMPTSVSLIALIRPEYDKFVRDFRRRLTDAGVSDDKKYFTDEIMFANITVCRYTHKPSLEFLKKLQEMKDIIIGPYTTKNVSLVTMNAGASPSKTVILDTYQFSRI